jgi:hypothetical protein
MIPPAVDTVSARVPSQESLLQVLSFWEFWWHFSFYSVAIEFISSGCLLKMGELNVLLGGHFSTIRMVVLRWLAMQESHP